MSFHCDSLLLLRKVHLNYRSRRQRKQDERNLENHGSYSAQLCQQLFHCLRNCFCFPSNHYRNWSLYKSSIHSRELIPCVPCSDPFCLGQHYILDGSLDALFRLQVLQPTWWSFAVFTYRNLPLLGKYGYKLRTWYARFTIEIILDDLLYLLDSNYSNLLTSDQSLGPSIRLLKSR